MFRGILIEKDESGYRAAVKDIDEACLPDGNVTVRVSHSTLNYKDGLAITGKGPVVRKFPMVPGIDLAGVVEESTHPEYQPGDSVLLNGWGVGEGHWGGLAQKARLNGDWLIPLPAQFSPRQAMAIGTAGYTHPITHISRLPELPCIAGAFYKDGDLLETQPDGFGAWLAVVPAGEETTALGNQAQHGVQGWHRFRDGLLVENEGGAPLVGLEHQVGG